ncbi:hypothetical protein F383_33648 [Gossypium arboreum]|uniref:Uncharacterized protein n=1 Tax=Gossypium arboreum TaxID=29729 RepID=A0A0B0PPZ3_GOSAR|nr:hypothetical protein F383_33648 [Gossypium arboreum]
MLKRLYADVILEVSYGLGDHQ